MADKTAIRRRIRSVKNTRQITKAMQLVAASKLRSATAAAEHATEYREQMDDALGQAAANPDWSLHPLVQAPDSQVTRLVLIGSDRGLAGPYHARLESQLRQAVRAEQTDGQKVEITTIGRKAALMARRQADVVIKDRHPGLGVLPSIWEVGRTAAQLMEDYQEGSIGRVVVVTTRFYSALRQETEVLTVLPLSGLTAAELTPPTVEDDTVPALVQSWLEAALYDATAQALASEQAMRMMAMQNATSNAGDMIDDLTLAYNTARQAAITQELAEISGGVAAMS